MFVAVCGFNVVSVLMCISSFRDISWYSGIPPAELEISIKIIRKRAEEIGVAVFFKTLLLIFFLVFRAKW